MSVNENQHQPISQGYGTATTADQDTWEEIATAEGVPFTPPAGDTPFQASQIPWVGEAGVSPAAPVPEIAVAETPEQTIERLTEENAQLRGQAAV